jgi:hypothetical protein
MVSAEEKASYTKVKSIGEGGTAKAYIA